MGQYYEIEGVFWRGSMERERNCIVPIYNIIIINKLN